MAAGSPNLRAKRMALNSSANLNPFDLSMALLIRPSYVRRAIMTVGVLTQMQESATLDRAVS